MKKETKKKYLTDVICAAVVIALFGGVAVFNLFQPNRPTVSESEKRTLAEIPTLTWQSLTDGTFFRGVSLFISDTFIARDSLVGMSKKLDTLRGVKYSLGEEDFVLLEGQGGDKKTEEDDDLTSKLAEALDTLNKQQTPDEPVTDPDVEPDTEDKEEIPEAKSEVLGNGDIREVISGGGDGSDVTEVSISKDALNLTVGSGSVLVSSVKTDGEGATVLWSVTDKTVAEISMNENSGIDVKGLKAGTCYVTCKAGTFSAQCEVTVTEIKTVTQNQGAENADFLADGLFIYGDAVYTQGAYSYTNAKNYADTALYYKNLFGNVTMSIVVSPVSSMVIDNPQITSQIPNQKAAMENMAALCDPSVNFVDTYSEMYAHKDEYLFFKTDHHWTARGAYYAYAAFAKSIGLEPTPLEGFDYVLKSEYYQGSMYDYTQDERVKNMYDSVEAFVPRKAHTMTITTRAGTTEKYDTSIVAFNKTYVSFIAGDNPYTVINVPENPQDKNVLVLKDSFGNAFVPFLCEHFGNIIVVDTRYSSFNIYEQLADYGITDIVFVNNIQAANSPAWSRLYLAAVGVN